MERKKNVPAFIRSTYEMLQREELKDIVSWQEQDNGFVIKKLDSFTNEVLPQYFKHKKYPSFVRQLNMYGFHKQRSKDNFHSYGHEFFKKGVLQNKDKLLFQQALKRKPEKKKKVSGEINNVKEELQRQQKSLSEEQDEEQRSVSIELEDEKEQKDYVHFRHPNQPSQSRCPPKESSREERRMSKTQSINISAGDIDENQSSSSVHQTKSDGIILQQNIILQSVHCAIREQLLKCKQMMRNKALGLGQILNNGDPVECALKLANLLNQQNVLLRKLAGLSSDLNDSPA